jgi:hypothetical protein
VVSDWDHIVISVEDVAALSKGLYRVGILTASGPIMGWHCIELCRELMELGLESYRPR